MAKILKITVKNAKITVKIPKIFAPPARFPYPHTPNQNSTYATVEGRGENRRHPLFGIGRAKIGRGGGTGYIDRMLLRRAVKI